MFESRNQLTKAVAPQPPPPATSTQNAGPVWMRVSRLHDACDVLEREINNLRQGFEVTTMRLGGVLGPVPPSAMGACGQSHESDEPAQSPLADELRGVDGRIRLLAQHVTGLASVLSSLLERVEV